MVAGGRRLQAVYALARDRVLDTNPSVPCLATPVGVEPDETRLAKNVVRAAMQPSDQVVAFSKLAEAG